MISFLGSLLNTVGQFGKLVLWGAIESLNVVISALEVVFSAAAGVFPSLPEVPAAPSFVSYMNWFLPIGSVVSTAVSLGVSYGTFLGVRWVFKKAGTL